MNSIEYVEEILVERREVIDGGIGETIGKSSQAGHCLNRLYLLNIN